jgi:hypothetical protein
MKLAAVLAVCLVFVVAPARAASDILVRGSVQNGTIGRPAPRGTRIDVAAVGSDGGRIDDVTARLDRKGRFGVRVDAVPGGRIVVSSKYRGITYSTVARPGAALARAGLLVFDPTRRESTVSVDADTTVLEPAGDDVEALQIVRMTNGSHRTFIGASKDSAVFRLPLPRNAYDVAVVNGLTPGRSEPAETELRAGDPLQPGDATISYAYKVRTGSGDWSLDRSSFYDTERMDVLVDPELELVGGGFELLGDIDFGDNRYLQYVRNDVRAGARISFSVNPASGAGIWPVAAGAGAVALLGIGAWRLGRSRSRRGLISPGGRAASAGRRNRRAETLTAIAALDLEHAAGDIPDGEYVNRREVLKSLLE